jgi:hypothetical protein
MKGARGGRPPVELPNWCVGREYCLLQPPNPHQTSASLTSTGNNMRLGLSPPNCELGRWAPHVDSVIILTSVSTWL